MYFFVYILRTNLISYLEKVTIVFQEDLSMCRGHLKPQGWQCQSWPPKSQTTRAQAWGKWSLSTQYGSCLELHLEGYRCQCCVPFPQHQGQYCYWLHLGLLPQTDQHLLLPSFPCLLFHCCPSPLFLQGRLCYQFFRARKPIIRTQIEFSNANS